MYSNMEKMQSEIELYLDIFFDKEYAEVEKLMEIFPIKLRLRWKR